MLLASAAACCAVVFISHVTDAAFAEPACLLMQHPMDLIAGLQEQHRLGFLDPCRSVHRLMSVTVRQNGVVTTKLASCLSMATVDMRTTMICAVSLRPCVASESPGAVAAG
jgi:hypothetical protein